MTNQQKEQEQGYPLFYIEEQGYMDKEIKKMSIEEVKTLIAFQNIKADILEIATIYQNANLKEYAENIILGG